MSDGFIKVGTTKGGKDIGYRPDPDGYALYTVCFADGGELPAMFKEKKYIDWKKAEFDIKLYLEVHDKAKKKAKSNKEAA
jgi:hypothetical protein